MELAIPTKFSAWPLLVLLAASRSASSGLRPGAAPPFKLASVVLFTAARLPGALRIPRLSAGPYRGSPVSAAKRLQVTMSEFFPDRKPHGRLDISRHAGPARNRVLIGYPIIIDRERRSGESARSEAVVAGRPWEESAMNIGCLGSLRVRVHE
jgi:hypothetical protein